MAPPIDPAPGLADIVSRAANEFTTRTGAAPRWAAAAPGRVNLIGEHTDYNHGFVLPIAIDRWCVCVAGPAKNPAASRLIAADLGTHVSIDLRQPTSPETALVDDAGHPAAWAPYILGAHEEFIAATGITDRRNLDLLVTSSVPNGSGLSSSASLEVSVATALEAAYSVALDPLAKARACQRAEHRYPKVPCGIMDQYASVFGSLDHALLIDCRTDTHTLVPMPPTDERGAVLVIVNSNVRHDLATGEYAKRRAACESAARVMGVPSLREATPFSPGSPMHLLSIAEKRCAIHVANEDTRVLNVVDMLRDGASSKHPWKRILPEIGKQFVSSHESLRDLYQVSCAELDSLVDIACATPGVYGARMTGGGFGGCIIALVRPQAVSSLAQRLATEYPAKHQLSCTVYQTSAQNGARTVPLP